MSRVALYKDTLQRPGFTGLPRYLIGRSATAARAAVAAVRRRRVLARAVPVRVEGKPHGVAAVYWDRHTVRSEPFATAAGSARYLQWRFAKYPLFQELADLWGTHDGEVVLDYGCGPGNDLAGFLIHTGARSVIGMDVSRQALELARHRVALHRVDPRRLELVQLSDADPAIMLGDGTVDFWQSQGVLHHVEDPAAILRELHRVHRAGGEARVMVYNRDSVWLHLLVAYVRRVLEGRFGDLTIEEAFSRTTDGEDCPIATPYRPPEWVDVCRGAGFEAEFLGAYPSRQELRLLKRHRKDAIADRRLPDEHRAFLSELELDDRGIPFRHGHPAGIGGCYLLRHH